MILKVAMPGKVQFKLIRREPAFFMAHEGDIHYIGGADVLPAPLETEQENEVIQDLATEEYAQEARSILIEHNLRLVVYIAKKFDNTGVGVEDLISIGTIGLIKSINTFNPGKNIKLATYASRCIENEILMYLRRNHKTRMEVSIDEPLNVDWDGNELLLSDILGTDEDVIYRDMENEAERRILRNAVAKLSERERTIVSLRFGLDTPDGQDDPEGGRGISGYFPVLYFPAGKKDHEAAEKRDGAGVKLRAAAAFDRHACTHSGMCCHAVKYSHRVLHAPCIMRSNTRA